MANVEKDIAEAILRSEGLSAAKLGLRFDRVVVAVLGRLRSFAEASVPEGSAVLVTITAPIRVPGRTADALKREIEVLASAGGGRAERSATVHDNSVRVRIVDHPSAGKPRLIGFVHNSDRNPGQLLDLAERWLRS